MKKFSKYPQRPNYKELKYVEFDEETGLWCIFGTDSGYTYKTHSNKIAANNALNIQ